MWLYTVYVASDSSNVSLVCTGGGWVEGGGPPSEDSYSTTAVDSGVMLGITYLAHLI